MWRIHWSREKLERLGKIQQSRQEVRQFETDTRNKVVEIMEIQNFPTTMMCSVKKGGIKDDL